MLLIFYGTQTGTAEGLARRLASHAEWKNGLKTKVVDLGECVSEEKFQGILSELGRDGTKFEDVVMVFITSTFNISQPPVSCQDAKAFFEGVKASDDFFGNLEKSGSRVHFSVLGLGDSCYNGFAAFAKFIDEKLHVLDVTAKRNLMPLNTLDADKPDLVEPTFLTWRTKLMEECHKLNMNRTNTSRDIDFKSNDKFTEIQNNMLHELNTSKSALSTCDVTGRSTLQPGIIELKIKFPEKIDYFPADTLFVLPENKSDDVKFFLDKFNCSSSTEILCSQLVDLSAPPTADLIETLEFYFELEEISANEIITVTDLLQKFESRKYSINETLFILSNLPRIKPREYTIASSPLASNESEVTICLSLVRDINKNNRFASESEKKKPIPGLASTFLESSRDTLLCKIEPSLFKKYIPDVNAQPLMLISNGTGIAMTKALLEHRLLAKGTMQKVVVYSGFRKGSVLYEDMLVSDEENQLEVCLALSEPQKKVYVQRKLGENRRSLKNFLHEENPIVLVCGSSTMVSGVKEKIEWRILGEDEFAKFKASGRLVIESFG